MSNKVLLDKRIGKRLLHITWVETSKRGVKVCFMHEHNRYGGRKGNWLISIRGLFVRGFGRRFEAWYF